MKSMGRLVRRRLIAGLIVIAPLGLTVYILWWLFTSLDGILGRSLYQALGYSIPGLGLVLLVLILLAVGWAAEKTLGAKVLDWWHTALDRVPLVSRVYSAIRRIIGTVFGGEDRRFFRSVLLFQYPTAGLWTIGFETGRAPRALDERVANGITVFLPTAPNPVTGFLIIVPEAEVIRLPVTVEEGFTYVLSAGAVLPMGPRPPARSPAPTEPPPAGASPAPEAP